MGMFDEYEFYSNHHFYGEDTIKAGRNDLQWTTKNGEQIPLTMMTDSHLKNCLKMFIEKDMESEWIPIFMAEIWYRKTFN